ncbi:MAG: c-type cytochrome [Holophagales bacterium]|nr:c-type cytochrome [Holophagales bacterium]
MSVRSSSLVASLLLTPCLGALLSGAAAQEPPAPQEAARPFSEEETLGKLRELLAGREREPAEEVFDSIEVLQGVPAGRLLKIMELGYSRSLGVTCTHCHDPKNFASDDKPEKRTARRMARLVEKLNGELLPAAVEVEGAEPTVNCTTCHRGQKKPALRLEARDG